MERKLTAIFAADVVGYSRLMGVDEVGTLEQLKAHRSELFDPKITEHHGRIVKTTGDGLLAEFASVVEAVECAVEIQREMADRNTDVSNDERMDFRIGINLGDVIVEGDDIYGDGVNVAARLEQLADPGGVCLSGTVYDQIESKLALGYEDLGVQTVKNIARPVRVYRAPIEGKIGAKGKKAAAVGGDKPSIAVLPFTNMSADPEQEYFADGITEDIITALSKVSALFVIARNSTFTYKGKAVDVKRVSRDLGVRNVLEGSVRRAGDRIRINAQLIDGTTAGHLWAEHYDRDLKDVFAVQDEVTRHIVDALQVTLTREEHDRLAHKDTENLEAYDYVLRGKDLWLRFDRAANAQAREMYGKAIELDPDYAVAYAEMARVYLQERNHGWSGSLGESLDQALAFAQKATALDDGLAQAHVALAFVYMWKKQHDLAIAEVDKGLAVEPNHADGHMYRAMILGFAGRSEESFEWVEKAIRLSPTTPFWYLFALGNVCFLVARYEEAIGACKRAAISNPNFIFSHLVAASSCGHLDRKDDARIELAECLRLHPGLSVGWAADVVPYEDPAVLERFVDGLRKAGLPE